VVVGQLTPGGPGELAGLMPGDALLEIDGRPVTDFGGFVGAIQRIRGAEGTVLMLRVRRAADGKVVQVAVTRRLLRGP
jgi:C-terminal processing protease CtpA/Prc